MQVHESGHRFDDDRARDRFFTQALEAVRQIPGVTSAAFTAQLPLSGDQDTYGVQFDSDPNDISGSAFRYEVSPSYFQTMRVRRRRGRLLDERDRAGAPLAIVISESIADRRFRGQDPIGRRMRVGPEIDRRDGPWHTIVGVVGNVKQTSLALDEPDAVYVTPTQWPWVDNVQSLVVRTTGDAAALAPAIRRQSGRWTKTSPSCGWRPWKAWLTPPRPNGVLP